MWKQLRSSTIRNGVAAMSRKCGRCLRMCIQVVTLVETLMKPLKENDTTLVWCYREMFYRTQHMTLVPISAGVAESAADVRARYNLRTPDALHVATAIDAECGAF